MFNSYSTDPVADAGRYSDSMESHNAAVRAGEAHYTNVIVDALTKTIRTGQTTLLPYVNRAGRIHYKKAEEVIADDITDGETFNALMCVIVQSDCPLVAKLRKQLADKYAYFNATDCAEASL